MPRRFDHFDLRVRRLSDVKRFYEQLLPALGFTREVGIAGWLTYETEGGDSPSEFFGVMESESHVANESRIAFRSDHIEDVDRLADIAVRAGAQQVEGPMFYDDDSYYAVFFEDPSGNRLEICCRKS